MNYNLVSIIQILVTLAQLNLGCEPCDKDPGSFLAGAIVIIFRGPLYGVQYGYL